MPSRVGKVFHSEESSFLLEFLPEGVLEAEGAGELGEETEHLGDGMGLLHLFLEIWVDLCLGGKYLFDLLARFLLPINFLPRA